MPRLTPLDIKKIKHEMKIAEPAMRFGLYVSTLGEKERELYEKVLTEIAKGSIDPRSLAIAVLENSE